MFSTLLLPVTLNLKSLVIIKMTIIKFPSKHTKPAFFDDITEDGYHVFSLKNAEIPNFYPNEFPDYPGVSLQNLKVDDDITIRVFFRIGSGEDIRIDGGYLDLEVEHIESDKVVAVIRTELPKEFSLGTGDSLEVFQDEILYKSEVKEHYSCDTLKMTRKQVL